MFLDFLNDQSQSGKVASISRNTGHLSVSKLSVLSPAVYAAPLYQVPAILGQSEERGLVKRENPGPLLAQ